MESSPNHDSTRTILSLSPLVSPHVHMLWPCCVHIFSFLKTGKYCYQSFIAHHYVWRSIVKCVIVSTRSPFTVTNSTKRTWPWRPECSSTTNKRMTTKNTGLMWITYLQYFGMAIAFFLNLWNGWNVIPLFLRVWCLTTLWFDSLW